MNEHKNVHMEVTYLDLIRIGDKLISLSRIESIVQEMLDLRQQGVSQAEVAKKFNTDRTFLSTSA